MQHVTTESLSKLQHIIDMNIQVDWRAFSFEEQNLHTLQWQERDGEPAKLIPLLKAYQRLLHILPPSEDHRALPLLLAGLHSAIQIASMAPNQFAERWATLFPGETALGEAVHRNAVTRRSNLLLHYVDAVQSSEPYYRSARFR